MHHDHAEMTHDLSAHEQNSKPELFLRDVIIMMNKDTLNECREHNKCADVKAYEQQILYGKTAHSLSKVV